MPDQIKKTPGKGNGRAVGKPKRKAKRSFDVKQSRLPAGLAAGPNGGKGMKPLRFPGKTGNR